MVSANEDSKTEPPTEPPVPKMVATGDAFYRWADITFEWAKAFDNEYERRAITSLVHKRAIAQANHPLAGKDKHMQLYICEYADGMRQLCYSLRQIQYLQHYIYESRLTDPNHVNNRKQPAEDPEDNEKPIRHIPIPAGLIPAESFKSVTPIVIDQDTRTLEKKLRRENKRRVKEAKTASMIPPVITTQAVAPPSSSASDVEPSSPPDYFEVAQQAILLARLGGLKAEQERREEQDPEQLEKDPATGRGLFIAIYARERPDFDGNPVLKDVGYDALYFAADPEAPGVCTELHDREHWLVEEEIGFDGAPAPYLFAKDIQLSGGSFPKPLAKLKRDFQRKLVDLWGRAGKGPVYILIHSADYDAAGLDLLGINVEEIQSDLMNFANSSSNGSKFWIDTARLFGEVEHGLPGDTSGPDHITTRSLTDIMTLIYGPPNGAANTLRDNTGNSASFTMKIFQKLVQNWDAKTFPEVRRWLAQKISEAPTTNELHDPPGLSISAATTSSSAAEDHSGEDHGLLANIVNAITNAKIDDGEDEPHNSMAVFPIDEEDSDWEGKGEFMVMNADGQLVPFSDDDEE